MKLYFCQYCKRVWCCHSVYGADDFIDNAEATARALKGEGIGEAPCMPCCFAEARKGNKLMASRKGHPI
jgi:hypothetical protein